jgi:hypothetical protein
VSCHDYTQSLINVASHFLTRVTVESIDTLDAQCASKRAHLVRMQRMLLRVLSGRVLSLQQLREWSKQAHTAAAAFALETNGGGDAVFVGGATEYLARMPAFVQPPTLSPLRMHALKLALDAPSESDIVFANAMRRPTCALAVLLSSERQNMTAPTRRLDDDGAWELLQPGVPAAMSAPRELWTELIPNAARMFELARLAFTSAPSLQDDSRDKASRRTDASRQFSVKASRMTGLMSRWLSRLDETWRGSVGSAAVDGSGAFVPHTCAPVLFALVESCLASDGGAGLDQTLSAAFQSRSSSRAHAHNSLPSGVDLAAITVDSNTAQLHGRSAEHDAYDRKAHNALLFSLAAQQYRLYSPTLAPQASRWLLNRLLQSQHPIPPRLMLDAVMDALLDSGAADSDAKSPSELVASHAELFSALDEHVATISWPAFSRVPVNDAPIDAILDDGMRPAASQAGSLASDAPLAPPPSPRFPNVWLFDLHASLQLLWIHAWTAVVRAETGAFRKSSKLHGARVVEPFRKWALAVNMVAASRQCSVDDMLISFFGPSASESTLADGMHARLVLDLVHAVCASSDTVSPKLVARDFALSGRALLPSQLPCWHALRRSPEMQPLRTVPGLRHLWGSGGVVSDASSEPRPLSADRMLRGLGAAVRGWRERQRGGEINASLGGDGLTGDDEMNSNSDYNPRVGKLSARPAVPLHTL